MFGIQTLAVATLGFGWYSPPQTVDSVDIERYLGLWYQIATYPQSFGEGCTGSTAEYTLLEDGRIGVRNQCFIGGLDGEPSIAEAIATVADTESNAKLTVDFGNNFPAPYWIIDLDQETQSPEPYKFAVVSDPFRTNFFILSRTPVLDEKVLAGILSRAEQQGLEPERLEYRLQRPE